MIHGQTIPVNEAAVTVSSAGSQRRGNKSLSVGNGWQDGVRGQAGLTVSVDLQPP